MRVLIDDALCTGHGRCYSLEGGLFDSDDEGHGLVVITGTLDEVQLGRARDAAANCPERAISIIDS